MRPLIALCLALSLAACDTAEPDATPGDTAGVYRGDGFVLTVNARADDPGPLGTAVARGEAYDLGGGFGRGTFVLELTRAQSPGYRYRGEVQDGGDTFDGLMFSDVTGESARVRMARD